MFKYIIILFILSACGSSIKPIQEIPLTLLDCTASDIEVPKTNNKSDFAAYTVKLRVRLLECENDDKLIKELIAKSNKPVPRPR